MNNSQSSLDSSSLSTPIDEARPASLTTSISSLPSARPPSELSPLQYTIPPVLWVQVTQDEDNFKRCDLSNVGPDPVIIRERLCQKFGLKPKDTSILVTELFGPPDNAKVLDDEGLLSACAGGDGKGTLKFLLKLETRKPTTSPAKLTLPPQALRPNQPGMLTVPDADKAGRDVRSTSISEDPNRKGHYNTTPSEMYGKSLEGEDGPGTIRVGPSDYFTARNDDATVQKDDTRMFEAAERAKKNRVNRSRTASGRTWNCRDTSSGAFRRPLGSEDSSNSRPGRFPARSSRVAATRIEYAPTRQGSAGTKRH